MASAFFFFFLISSNFLSLFTLVSEIAGTFLIGSLQLQQTFPDGFSAALCGMSARNVAGQTEGEVGFHVACVLCGILLPL